MQVYQSKLNGAGTSYEEAAKIAWREYHRIQAYTPRRYPYVRSVYFRKDKIFVNQFWVHLNQKPPHDRLRRLKLFACAIDVIRNSPFTPESTQNPSNNDQLLHRFTAQTKNGELFYVQIRENKQTGRKDFMSVFPVKPER